MKWNVITTLIVILTGLTACNTPIKTDDTETNPTSAENKYKTLEVSNITQYAQDLAFYDSTNIGRRIQTTNFDTTGRMIKITRYDKIGDICYTEHITPTDENPDKSYKQRISSDTLTIKNFDPDDELINRVAYTYNENGNKKSMIKCNAEDSVTAKTTYKYYPNGLLKQDIYWNVDINKPEQIITYKYEFCK
jgi:hypothetical protein